MVLARLPLTANGKAEGRALPAPELAPAEEKHAAPRTPAEEVLGWSALRVEESCFYLGGPTFLAARVVSRVREPFGVEVPLRCSGTEPPSRSWPGVQVLSGK